MNMQCVVVGVDTHPERLDNRCLQHLSRPIVCLWLLFVLFCVLSVTTATASPNVAARTAANHHRPVLALVPRRQPREVAEVVRRRPSVHSLNLVHGSGRGELQARVLRL